MSWSFWLASIGILLSLLGTLLLVFCIPIFARSNLACGTVIISVPDEGERETNFHFAWNLFKSSIKSKDRTLTTAIASLFIGSIFQIVALIDC
ncbi:MAG: hypothetical protein ABR985_03290 [Methanotrichaceae archaeon]|jgi:hypothetical protein